MHNLEFGECTVLGSLEGNILMVDCGSMNVKIRESDMEVTDYVENNIVPRYFDAKERSFLLTHFHRDHMSGLRYLLKRDHGFFHRVFVPAASVNREGRALLIEFALYVFAFLGRQSEYSQMSVSALRIFERLHYALGIGNVYSLSRGSQFDFEGVAYDVLWPAAGGYPFSPLLTEIVEEPRRMPFLALFRQRSAGISGFEKRILRRVPAAVPADVAPEPGVSGGYGGISFPLQKAAG